MARKKSRQKKSARSASAKRSNQAPSRKPQHADLGVPKPDVDQFMALYKAKRLGEAESEARTMTQRYPESAFAWKALGTTLLEDGRVEEALSHLLRSVDLDDSDPLSLTSLAAVYYRQGDHDQAVRYQSRAVELQPDYAPAQYRLAEMLQMAGKHFKALEHAKKAQDLGYDDFRSRVLVGALLYQTKYFSEALIVYKQLEEEYPANAPVYNNLGNLYKDIGQYELSEVYYQKALDTQPGYVMAYSNIFFAKHYNPNASQQEIIKFAKGWDRHFSLAEMPTPDRSRDMAKPLRVGMISSGFRIHPVGQMIATAMEHSRPDIHFYAYSTNDYDDCVTQKIRESTRVWRSVRHLSQEALAQQIRDDSIDILIDLSGHGDGSCLQAISMRPAPLCIKWVGGLVNTMGLSSIDYLLSDSIETPEGVDDQYTEKLIRLPDDYICYMPCPYAPNTSSVPAIKNGYITLGCLNNPAKIGERLLAEWAKLMQELPESRLLLRGAQYESKDYCQKIRETLSEQGIGEYRIIFEGPTKHKDFLETYQRIDIALDTWPYSGGLTTCEAMLMGVPVVTLPGPTFAGRHSATHLINAGLQELVTSSWEEYRHRVLELANDLPNLAVIRAGLRTILHYSPVCDAPRFANHFNNALRAVWVRYCEGKKPEALTFNKEGELWFEDDKQPIELPEARSEETSDNESFEWQLDEPITIIDNAAVLPRHPDYPKWMASGHLAVISFDPASLLNNRVEVLQEYGELHHYPHALLGDGQPATLYATLNAEKGSTLKPLPKDSQPEYLRDKLKVLAELPINSVALDQIEGLPSVDALVLDDLHDAMKVLENGKETLKDALLIQVRVAFQPTHERQPNLAELQHWASRNGFRFYSLTNLQYYSHFTKNVSGVKSEASELVSADALFILAGKERSSSRLKRCEKLSFILHSMYGINDMAYALLQEVDAKKAARYLKSDGFVKGKSVNQRLIGKAPPVAGPEIPNNKHVTGKPKVSVVCATYNHVDFIEDAIKGFVAQRTNFPFEIIIHDDASTDGTQDVIKKYAEKYPDIIRPVYQEENQYSKNNKPIDIVLKLTKAKYVAMCDGDDYWTDSRKLQIQFDYMERNPGCVVTHHNAFVFDETGLVKESKLPKNCIKSYSSDELLKNNCFVLIGTMMFRKVFEVFPEEKNHVGNGDNFLISMLGSYGFSKYLDSIGNSAYRLHPDSVWSSKDGGMRGAMLANTFYWIGKYHERQGRNAVAEIYREKALRLKKT